MEYIAELFTYRGDQAVDLPDEFRFEGNKVNIRKDPVTGNVILSPYVPKEKGRHKIMTGLRDKTFRT